MSRARKHPAAEPASPVAEQQAGTRRQLAGIAKVAAGMGAWRPAPEVMREVEAVPTCFPQLDAVTRVGGWPISRVNVIFGPSAEGKTELLIGLGRSFLERGHFFAFLDLEHTTPPSWAGKLMGEVASHPGFVALPPGGAFEDQAVEVRKLCRAVKAGRDRGDLAPDTTALIGVDSIRKLMPRDLMKRLSQEVSEDGGRARGKRQGVDGYGGRAAQIRAALIASWLDELVPLLAETRCGVTLISRETVDDGDEYVDHPTIGGGRAVFYDTGGVCARVTKHDLAEKRGDERVVLGEQHVVAIYKSKVAGRLEKRPYAAFYTSNGRDAPEGFWPERDVLELAEELGVVELRGSHYSFGRKRLGNGKAGTLRRLAEDREVYAELDRATRAASRPKP